MRLERACYHCPAGRRGSCPSDRALDLKDTSLSPATTRLVGMTAAEVSFAKASELLSALAGVEVETRQVERSAEALGHEIVRDECAVREQTAPAPAPTGTGPVSWFPPSDSDSGSTGPPSSRGSGGPEGCFGGRPHHGPVNRPTDCRRERGREAPTPSRTR